MSYRRKRRNGFIRRYSLIRMETFCGNDNHSIAYCMLGYLCAYYRFYHPLEFLTSFLNNAANDEDIQNGTNYAGIVGIKVTMPRWGISKSDYFFNKEKNIIAKGLSSIKYMSESVANELYALSQKKSYSSFVDLLKDIDKKTSVNSRQLDSLIKLDFFSDFGNQRELLRINNIFCEIFKKGEAKKIAKNKVEGTPLGDIIEKYSVGVTKSGGIAKSYTLLDTDSLLQEVEKTVKAVGISDLPDTLKIKNVVDIMGYMGYISGKEEDRRKLYILDIHPLCRKKDGKQFGFSVITKSIGSGKESRFTIFNRIFMTEPIIKGDIILCKGYERDGKYFKMTNYSRLM